MKRDKDKEKELEELMNLQKNENALFNSLYGDLFGSGNSVKPPAPVSENAPKPADVTELPEMPAEPKNPLISGEELAEFLDNYQNVSQDDALKHATDALKEAREMLTGLTMDLLGNITDEPPKTVQVPGDSEVKKEEKTAEVSPAPPEAQKEAAKPEEPEEDPIEELDALIGLTTIKKDVKELADFVKIQKMRKDLGMKSVPVSLHLVFTGNPGTGKTTVARILSKIYKQIGVLSKGQLVEVDRSGLVAGYVGQTALKTQERIKEALGGILFIDEAYSLSQKDDAFGQEAIETILKAMEDNRDNLVVIVAGYTGPMEKFINSNPGLKSRFNKYIEFPDYTLDELEGIFNLSCKKYDYHPDEDAARQIRELLKLRMMTRRENFANAREARNLFEEIVTNQARRIAAIENPTHEQITAILVEDLYEKDEETPEPEQPEVPEEPEIPEAEEKPEE